MSHRWRLIKTLAVALCAVSADSYAQTTKLTYSSSIGSEHNYVYMFDVNSNALLRIDPSGKILLILSPTQVYEGKAGANTLKPSYPRSESTALRVASRVFPQLIISGIENDTDASIIESPGPLGGPTYEGTYPNGNRLMPLEEFPATAQVKYSRVRFDLDERGRLARIRYPDTLREEAFDLADDASAGIPYVRTFANGMWVLDDVQIYAHAKPELFQPESVVTLAREVAFESEESRRSRQNDQAATPEGRQKLERLREDTLNTGLNQSTKRFALILTGLIVIAVGSLAWWKNRS